MDGRVKAILILPDQYSERFGLACSACVHEAEVVVTPGHHWFRCFPSSQSSRKKSFTALYPRYRRKGEKRSPWHGLPAFDHERRGVFADPMERVIRRSAGPLMAPFCRLY